MILLAGHALNLQRDYGYLALWWLCELWLVSHVFYFLFMLVPVRKKRRAPQAHLNINAV